MQFTLSADEALAVARRLDALPSRVISTQRRALGTLRRRWPVQARRDIQSEYAVKAQRVASALTVRSGSDGLVLIGAARGIGLLNFNGRPTAKGVAYTALKGQRRTRSGGFVRSVGHGPTAFERARGADGRRVGRMPIQRLYGPSVAQMLRKHDRPVRLAQAGLTVIANELHRLLRRPLHR